MPVQVECPSCGKLLRAKSKYAGRVIRCSGCGQPMRLPDEIATSKVARPEEIAAPARSEAETPSEVEPEPEPPAAPAPSGGIEPFPISGRAIAWIIGGTVGGLLVLGAIAVVLLLLFMGAGAGAFRSYMLDDADMMAHLDVATVLQSALWEKVKTMGGRDFARGMEEMTKATGLTLEDIQDVWLAGSVDRERMLLLVTTTGSVDLKEVFEKKLEREPEEEDGVVFYDVPGGPRMSAHLVDSQTVLIGRRDDLLKGVKRSREGVDSRAAAALEEMAGYVSTSAAVWMATTADPSKLRRTMPRPMRDMLGMATGMGAIKGGALSVSVNGSVSASVAMVLDSPEDAEKIQAQVEEMLSKGREALADAPADSKEADMIRQVLDGLSVSTSGAALCGSISLDNDVVMKLIEMGGGSSRRAPRRYSPPRPRPRKKPARPTRRWRR